MANNCRASSANHVDRLSASVPKARSGWFNEVAEHIDAFCNTHLNTEYKSHCRKMALTLCRKRSLVLNGKSESWAAGIIYALGQVNFLMDRSQDPHTTSAEIAKGLGVSVSTMQAKATIIRKALKLFQFHPNWTLPSKVDDSLVIWLLEVNGILMDIRTAPRGAQVAAYERGLIPYIPADRQVPAKDDIE
jgi:hypothetical protein